MKVFLKIIFLNLLVLSFIQCGKKLTETVKEEVHNTDKAHFEIIEKEGSNLIKNKGGQTLGMRACKFEIDDFLCAL